MSEEINKKVNQLRTFFKKNQAKNHPIKNHPLAECDEYVKGLYFDMLCVMAQYENEDTENQNKFIQRIMSGCNETMPIAEHIKRAMSLTVENITEFLKQCKDNNLSDIFFMDSLLISCGNGAPNKKQVEFIAEIADVLGFDKAKTKFMSELAVAILEQDFEKLKGAASDFADLNDEMSNTNCYIQPVVDKNVVSTDSKKIFYSVKLTDKPLFKFPKNLTGEDIRRQAEEGNEIEYIKFSKLDEIVFENQYINTPLEFTSIKSVVFKNCRIDNSYGNFSFDSVENITIENCIFTGFDGEFGNTFGGAMWLDNSSKTTIIISDSKFSDYDIPCGGGVIYSDDDYSTVKFTNCEFNNIDSSSGVITELCNVYVDGCYFSNCNGFELFSQCYNYEKGPNESKFIGCCREK